MKQAAARVQQHHEGEQGRETLHPTAAFGRESAVAAAKPADPASEVL